MRCDSCSIGVPGAFLNCFLRFFPGDLKQVSKYSVFCQSLGAQGFARQKNPDAMAKISPPLSEIQRGRGGKPTALQGAVWGYQTAVLSAAMDAAIPIDAVDMAGAARAGGYAATGGRGVHPQAWRLRESRGVATRARVTTTCCTAVGHEQPPVASSE
ncbi:hypothetical protein XACM_3898 [Xanthomonas euvesicatoria pv. citrumelo F1]|nr:hypothetical protein XACM_3898 [Xanthomonas euvesicatoria pv. citrumelo F1]